MGYMIHLMTYCFFLFVIFSSILSGWHICKNKMSGWHFMLPWLLEWVLACIYVVLCMCVVCMYIYDDLIDNMQSVRRRTNCYAICGLGGLDPNLCLWPLYLKADWAFSGKLYALLPAGLTPNASLITITHLELLTIIRLICYLTC